jgi:hypothetical protein
MGTTVRVTGTLQNNDDGVSLRMGARDAWKALPEARPVLPRTLDLTAPALEDGWSLVEVTGTVRDVKAQRVGLDLGMAGLDLVIRPVVRYRAARLKAGDVVRVRGILDVRGEDLRLYPRSADEIEIVQHAPVEQKPMPVSSGLPPWVPFGAAGATVAATHGWKRLKKIREQRKLKRLLEQATKL